MRQFLQGKYGVCILIESLPSLSSGDIHRYAPGKLASDESKLKKVFEEMDIPHDPQFPDGDAVAFDPQFVQGPGRHHPLLVDWCHSHSFNPDGSRMLEFEESDEYPDSGECPDGNALGDELYDLTAVLLSAEGEVEKRGNLHLFKIDLALAQRIICAYIFVLNTHV